MSDHIGEPNAMICPHCGLPADRKQNGIQGYRCGSSYEPTFKPQWARSMTCLEIENKKLKGDLDLAYFGEDALIANVRNLRAHIKRLEDIIKRAGYKFFEDGPDGRIAVNMLTILDEAREAKP